MFTTTKIKVIICQAILGKVITHWKQTLPARTGKVS